MAALALSPPWIPDDDLLLKNAVEAGASLEALAKGAVQFSRRFTFQELQDRWHSLLYDPDISAQASARMGELQGSASNLSSEFNRSDKAAQSKIIHEKRKNGSIRKQFYAMRKKIRSDFFSVDLGFLDEPNPHNCSGNGGEYYEHATLDNGHPVGNFTPNRFGLQGSDFDILPHAFPQTMTGIDEFHSGGPDPLADNHISRVSRNDCLHEFHEDISSFSAQDSQRNGEAESFQHPLAHKGMSVSIEHNSVGVGQCANVEGMGSSQPLPGTRPFEIDDSEVKPGATFDSTNNNLHTMGFSPRLPSMHLWKTLEDKSAPAMPVDMSLKDKNQGAEDVSAFPGNVDNEGKGSSGPDDLHSGSTLIEQQIGDGFITPTLSDGEFADLSESLFDFSNGGDVLFLDMDGNDTGDKSCCDSSLLASSPLDASGGDSPKVEPMEIIVSNTGFATAGITHPGVSEVTTSQLYSVHGDQQTFSRSRVNMPSTSVLTSKPLELNLGNTNCTLNTEDPEIPCNDDIFLLIHPAASFAFPATRPIVRKGIDPSSFADEKDAGLGLNFLKKGEDLAQSFVLSQMVGPHMLPAPGPKHALVGCTVKPELPDTSRLAVAQRLTNKAIGDSQCKAALPTPNAAVDGKLEIIVPKVEFALADTPGTLGEIPLHAEASPIEITHPESVVNPSTSDHEEQESDNDVPYFSDIEAMILEMDLCSYEEDTYFTTRVSRYQREDSKRKVRRLEQCAQSSLQRAIASQGALAILYGRRLKYFIRETEVVLGRSTEEIDVDIDLGKEGRANKISRRQALIKMETDGSFFLKNLGKTSISVNGKAVATGQSMGLTSSCLIEIRGMSFIFEMNHKCVKRCLDNIAKKNQVTNFEWSPAVET